MLQRQSKRVGIQGNNNHTSREFTSSLSSFGNKSLFHVWDHGHDEFKKEIIIKVYKLENIETSPVGNFGHVTQ